MSSDDQRLPASALATALELIGAGTPVTRQQVRALVDDEGGHALAEETVDHVVETAAKVARWRRREAELSALMSSARELVEVRDVQRLLQRLVDRAHDLMTTDITYLSEYDEDTDELWVRATRGSVSPDLGSLRVPAGVGLASAVVRSRTAQWTADYDLEQRFPHDALIDAAIRTEAMRSVLGVPMIAGGQVLGVLFAADRSAHSFGAEEIALLTAFADHAAVILQTARLFAAERASAERAAAAHSMAAEHAAATEQAAAVHEDLTRVVLAGQGADEVTQLLARSLRRPVAFVDRDLRHAASTTATVAACWDTGGRLDERVRAALEDSRQSGHCAHVDDPGEPLDGMAVVAAVAGTLLLGGLVVDCSDGTLSEVERRTVERAGQIVALLTMQRDAATEAEERLRGDLVADLVAGRLSADEIARRGSAQGITLNRHWAVVVVRADVGRYRARQLLGAGEAAHAGWLVGDYDTGVVVLVPETDPTPAAQAVRNRLTAASAQPCLAVGARRTVPPEGIVEIVGETWACADLLPNLGVDDAAVVSDAYAPYLAMFGPSAELATGFVAGTLGPVTRWDAAHGTDLLRTLAVYLAHNCSPAATARELYVHVNTIKQRLDRLAELLGPGWREPESMFRLSVAVRLHQARTSSSVPSA